MASVQAQLDESELAGLDLHDGLFDYQLDTTKLRADPNYRGFDNNCGSTWIYPTNYPVRKYQYDITHAALYRNTLVVLPTGLGKTFIAAVVMYNLYRWYPRGKVIFMAPTKPLVAQQIEACYQIMGIAKEDTAELTGKQAKPIRESVWRSKRVFFVTPQVLAHDLVEITAFPVDAIKLIVVDEAHKARGRYAYTEVIRTIRQTNQHFRVLALSATPGRAMEDVALVVRNLHISHVEVRSETSPDVAPYTHKKNIQTIVVKLDAELTQLRRDLLEIIDPYLAELQALNAVTGSLENLHRGWLIVQQKQFLDGARQSRHPDHSHIMTNYASCISLYHGLELLERHGTRIFLNFFEDSDKFVLSRDMNLRRFLDRVRQLVGPNPFADGAGDDQRPVVLPAGWDFGHPKYAILRHQLMKHFAENEDTRSLVFCEYRESAHLIYQLLLQDRPVVKPKVFVGQNGSKSLTQKQQIAIMSEFRQGQINVLIATCVAEEGIDVGETDLIVCFDVANKNPTRFVQRIGRTGRKRDGKVLMLATEGKEQRTVKDVLSHRDQTNLNIAKSQELANVLQPSPRMVPTEFDPKCIETFIKINGVIALAAENDPTFSTDSIKPIKGIKAKKPEKLPGTQDVRNFFKPIKLSEPVAESRNESLVYNDTMDYPEDVGSPSVVVSTELGSTSRESPNKCVELDARVLQNLKKFRSLKRDLLRTNPISVEGLNIGDVVRRSLAPQSLQKYSLMHNVPYLKTQLDKSSEKISKKSAMTIDQIFGGAERLRSFIETSTPVNNQRQPLKIINLSHCINHSTTDPTPLRAVDKVYHTIPDKEDTLPDEVIQSQFIDPLGTQLPQFIETESRYQSYVLSPDPMPKMTTSTPVILQKPPRTSKRNPHKSPRRFSKSPKQTPIKMAFERMRSREKLTSFHEPIEQIAPAARATNLSGGPENEDDECIAISRSPSPIRSRPKMSSGPVDRLSEVLRFFRLTNVMDIFVDDAEVVTLNNSVLDIGGIDDIFVSDDSFDGPGGFVAPSKGAISSGRVNNLNTSSSDTDDFEESPRKQQGTSEKTTDKMSTSNRLKTPNRLNAATHLSPPKLLISSNHNKNKSNFIVTPTKRETTAKNNLTFNNDISDIFADSFSVKDPYVGISSDSDNEAQKLVDSKPNKLHTIPEAATIQSTDIPAKPSSSDDCIQPSQSSCSPPIRRSLSSKLSKLAANIQRRSSVNAAKPTRQISDDLFEVTTTTTRLTEETEELSSSLKENSNQNPALNEAISVISSLSKTTSCESERSPRKRTVFGSPPPLKPANLKDVTTSPSVLAPRISFSRLISRVQSKKSTPLSAKFSLCAENEQASTAPNRAPDLSKFESSRASRFASQANTTLSPIVANRRKAKRTALSSSSSSEDDDMVVKPSSTKRGLSKVVSRRRKCGFIDEECEVSGDNSEDEEANATMHLTGLINDDVADETIGIDMRAIYMQSVRSPVPVPFRRPAGRHLNNISNVFSQAIASDDDSYGECSFVVSDDDDVAPPAARSPDLCPLERAELIMKQRRAAKRLGIQLLSDEDEPGVVDVDHRKKKRRRICRTLASSDEED